MLTSPEKALAYAERYINDGSPSGFTERFRTSVRTDPFGPDPYFYLYSLRPPGGLLEDYGTGTNVPTGHFFIHPDMCSHQELSGFKPTVWSDHAVVPTSSARTVQILTPAEGDYIKLHYDGVIGRVNRRLPRRKAINGPEMSSMLLTALLDGTLPRSLALLHEPLARFLSVPGNQNPPESWSFIWRERLPSGMCQGK